MTTKNSTLFTATLRPRGFRAWLPALLLAGQAALVGQCIFAQGIPEPSFIYYGVVRNTAPPGPRRLSYGTLRWTIQEVGGASLPIVLTIPLTNINDQFSYVVRIPCETQLGATPVSSGNMRLTPAGVQINRSQVQVNGTVAATLLAPATPTATYTSRDRGRLERIDLEVNIPCVDLDGNGVCDDWEIAYLGALGTNLNEDSDGDGLTNYQEYLADTNPLDPNSRFAFIDIKVESAGVLLRWSSVPERVYTVFRSEDLSSGFTAIRTGERAVSNIHQYRDTNASPTRPNFYRLTVE